MRPFRCIYENRFNRLLVVFLQMSAKIAKMDCFGQFKDHNSARKHGN